MPRLEMLGRIRVVGDDGSDLEALHRQPKRLAVLAYLALPRPGTWHRRDTVVALFWPESTAGQARQGLRNALYAIRRGLTEDVVLTRGDEEIALDPHRFATDVAQLESAAAAGRHREALDLYRGPLLPGLFVPDAEGFEKWLDGERQRIAAMAREAALRHLESLEEAGDRTGAAETAARLVELDPDDERAVRRLMNLWDRVGEHGKALATYERLRARLAEEYHTEPAAETASLARELRARRAASELDRVSVLEPLPAAPAPARAARRRALLPYLAAAGTAAALAGLILARPTPAADRGRSLVVTPMENATGSAEQAYLASSLGDELADRLRGIGAFQEVRSAARAQWPDDIRRDPEHIGRALGADLLLRTRLERDGDSLVVIAELADLAARRATEIGRVRFAEADPRMATRSLVGEIMGSVFRAPVPEMPGVSAARVDPESYRLTLQGWYALLVQGQDSAALQAFSEAVARDRANARAWSGLSSLWASRAVTWGVPFAEGAERSEAASARALALDSTQGTPLANRAVLTGFQRRDLRAADSLLARAIRLEPGNPEIYMVQAGLYRHAWQYDRALDAIRVARQMDPLSAWMVDREAVLLECVGRVSEALPLRRLARRMAPGDARWPMAEARTLALLGRWDEAATVLRDYAAQSGDSAMRATLDREGGAAGYRRAMEVRGRARLKRALAEARDGWVSPVRLGVLYVAAGEHARGLELLETNLDGGDPGLYRLPCHPDMDAVRTHPRFVAILAALDRTRPR